MHRFSWFLGGLLLALAPALRAAELDAPPPGTFTIVVIPDSQGYRGAGTKATPASTEPLTNEVLQNHTRWIAGNLQAQNIVFVSHVGDIVDLNNDEQWRLARECLDRLHGIVPHGLTVGNHDMEKDGDASLFQKYFPAERYRMLPWYGGSYQHPRPDQNVSCNNVNSYQFDTTKREVIENSQYVADPQRHNFTLDYPITPAKGPPRAN